MGTMDIVKRRIITSMIAIVLLVITLFGITYAYFLAKVQGNKEDNSISISAGKLELTYDDGNGILEVSEYLQPGEPVKFYSKDSEGNIKTDENGNPITVDKKTFSVKNTGKNIVDSYEVILENVINELEYYEDLTYVLTCRSSDENNSTCNGVTGAVFPRKEDILVTNSIDVGVTHSYELTLQYIDTNIDQSKDMKKTISAKINIIDDERSLSNLIVYGNSIQGDTPYPNSPAEIVSLGDLTDNLWSYGNLNGIGQKVISDCYFEEGTYTILADVSSSDTNANTSQIVGLSSDNDIVLNIQMNRINNSKKTFTISKPITKLIFRASSKWVEGSTETYSFNNIYLKKGETISDYEPYGKYKVPIAINGKNLISYPYEMENTTKNDVSVNVNTDRSITIDGTSTSANVMNFNVNVDKTINLKPGTYTFSLNRSDISNINEGLYLALAVTTNGVTTYPSVITTKTFTFDSEAIVKMYVQVKAGAVIDNVTIRPQLENGSERTYYENYIESVETTLYLDEPLRSVGDCEKCSDYIDFKNNKVVRNVGEIILDGTENWEKVSDYFRISDVLNALPFESSQLNTYIGAISNRFVWNASGDNVNEDCFWYNFAGTGLRIKNLNYANLKVDEFQDWLDSNNVIIYYILNKIDEENIDLPYLAKYAETSIVDIKTNVQPSKIEY